MHRSGIVPDVFLKTLYEKSMDDLGLVVRNLFRSETRVELESVATGAVGGKLDGFQRRRVARSVKSGGLVGRCGGNQISCVGELLGFACQVVAILASHLNALAIRAHEVGLHMEKVV